MHWVGGKGNTLTSPSHAHVWMLYNVTVQPVGGDVHSQRLPFVFCSPFHPRLLSIRVPPPGPQQGLGLHLSHDARRSGPAWSKVT